MPQVLMGVQCRCVGRPRLSLRPNLSLRWPRLISGTAFSSIFTLLLKINFIKGPWFPWPGLTV